MPEVLLLLLQLLQYKFLVGFINLIYFKLSGVIMSFLGRNVLRLWYFSCCWRGAERKVRFSALLRCRFYYKSYDWWPCRGVCAIEQFPHALRLRGRCFLEIKVSHCYCSALFLFPLSTHRHVYLYISKVFISWEKRPKLFDFYSNIKI